MSNQTYIPCTGPKPSDKVRLQQIINNEARKRINTLPEAGQSVRVFNENAGTTVAKSSEIRGQIRQVEKPISAKAAFEAGILQSDHVPGWLRND